MKKTSGRQTIGIFFIVVGLIWALKNLDIFSYQFEYYYLSWPFFMMVIGFIVLIRSKGSFFGFMLLFVGGAFFLSRVYDYSVGDIFSNFWPLFLIAIGISIMLEYWRERPKKNSEEKDDPDSVSDDFVEINSVFGEEQVNIDSQNFRGAKVSTFIGATKLILLNARPSKNCVIDVMTLMGGTEIHVPSTWRIKNNSFTLFGGTDESRRKSAPTEGPEQPEVTIKGLVLFGGLEIKS